MKMYRNMQLLKMKILLFCITIIVITFQIAQGKSNEAPKISGNMVYHTYSTYDKQDSKLYILNFDTGEKKCISDNFHGVFNAMNASFNNDGSKIVFMGMVRTKNDLKWDIFTYDLNTNELINLTAENDLRNEDPKFSPDGKKIIFKQGHWDIEEDEMIYDLKELNLKSKKVKSITSDIEEDSMPYYSQDGKSIYYARGVNSSSKIYKINIDSEKVEKVYGSNKVMSYYPVIYGNELYFTKWYSKSNNNDIIVKMNLDSKKISTTKFSNKNFNSSDPCPISDRYVIMSSTKSKGEGGYDLYIADSKSGKTWSLNMYNNGVNDDKNQLGANCYIKSIED